MTGSLPKSSIRSVIRSANRKIRYCYQRGLNEKPKLAGTMKVIFTILPSGETTNFSVKEPFDENVDFCVLNVISKLKFPEPDGEGSVRVIYPFNFKS